MTNRVNETPSVHTQIIEAADEWTRKHLRNWLTSEFTDVAIDEHEMYPRMLAVYNSDPEFWANQSWWKVFDAARISRTA